MKNFLFFLPASDLNNTRIKKLLLIMDFDGTLARISRKPELVTVDTDIACLLKKLSNSPDCKVAIITGRSLKDIRKRLKINNILFFGNHGLEFEKKSLTIPKILRRSRLRKKQIQKLLVKLKFVFSSFRGVYIEDKVYSITVHYRQLNKKLLPRFQYAWKSFLDELPRANFKIRRAKKAWEIIPNIQWDKGSAALYLSKHYKKYNILVIGDDKTDEDMFLSLKKKAITVRVGKSRKSFAEYYLESQNDVRKVLRCLCKNIRTD